MTQCCKIYENTGERCVQDAEFEIHEQAGEPYSGTQACVSHVGDLLGSIGPREVTSWTVIAI